MSTIENLANGSSKIITVLDMCPICKSGKPGDIEFIHSHDSNWLATSFNCLQCGFLFPELNAKLLSNNSITIKWSTGSELDYYETSQCPQCKGISVHKSKSNVVFRDEADDQTPYQWGVCRICSWQERLMEPGFPELLSLLSASDPMVRGSAAQKLCKFKDPRAVEPLLAALSDENEFVRDNAVFALGEMEDSSAVLPLISAIQNENIKTHLVVKALGKLQDKRAVEPILKLLNPQNQEISEAAINALSVLADPAAIPDLLQFIYSSVPDSIPYGVDNRYEAIKALANLGAVEPIICVLSNADYNIRLYITKMLGGLEDRRAVQPLIDIMLQGSDEILKCAAESLAKLHDPSAVPALLTMLDHSDWSVRYTIANALGAIGDKRAVVPLIKALSDSSSDYSYFVRKHAAVALGKIGDPQAIEPLIDALTDSSIEVRINAIIALGVLGDAKAVEVLRKIQSDRDLALNVCSYDLQHFAAESIEKLIADIKEGRKEVADNSIKESRKEVRAAEESRRSMGKWFENAGERTGDAFRALGRITKKFFTGE
jgi:HEAT repeat protein